MQLNITEEEFKELYHTLTYPQIKERLKISDPAIAKIAKELGLSKKTGRPKEGIVFKKERTQPILKLGLCKYYYCGNCKLCGGLCYEGCFIRDLIAQVSGV